MKVLLLILLLNLSALAKSKLDIPLPRENFPSKNELLSLFAQDFPLGNKNAKVKMVVFDSYSCFHCADFYNDTFPEIERRYIKTGKVYFIHKEFPLDKIALFATKVVHCSVNPLQTIDVIYKKQSKFLVKDYEKKLLEIEGVNKDCVKSFNEDIIIKQTYEYSKVLKLNSTPTIYINGDVLQKRGIENIIDKINESLGVDKPK